MRRLFCRGLPEWTQRALSDASQATLNIETALHPSNRQSVPRRHRNLHLITLREEKEEKLRDFLPPKPVVPSGWTLEHISGSNRFDLKKTVEIRDSGKVELHALALMEVKEYESTYRMDNGEREEQEYLFFTLFLQKQRSPVALEFGLTSIDMELVLDSLAIHSNKKELEDAVGSLTLTSSIGGSFTKSGKNNLIHRYSRDSKYRGPMLSELDDDLSDEILDYLDERGVNNGFAEYMMAQAHYFEQEEYLNWIRLLRQFAQ